MRFPRLGLASTLLALVTILALAVTPARGQGTTSDLSACQGRSVSSIQVQGVPADLADQIQDGLALAQSRFLRHGPLLFPKVFQADTARVLLFLARHGYPEARLSARFQSLSRNRVRVVLQVEPGSPVMVADVADAGAPPELTAKVDRVFQIHAGDQFADETVQGTATAMSDLLKRSGYAAARVRTRVAQDAGGRASVRYEITPGPVHFFRQVLVDGIPEDLVPLARRTIEVERGERYTPLALIDAQERLQLLDLFSQIRLSEALLPPDSVDVRAAIQVRRAQVVEVAAGYMTDDRLSLKASWTHRNLWGRGRGVRTSAAWSRFSQNVSVFSRWPDLFGTQKHGDIQASMQRNSETSYDETDIGVQPAATYLPSLRQTAQLGISVANVAVKVKTSDGKAFAANNGLLTFLFVTWNRNSVDNRLAPTRGSVTSARVEWAPDRLVSRTHYVLADLSGMAYVPVHRFVLAGHLESGMAVPTGTSSDLLPNKQFFAGGVKSMRGFSRRALGPLDPTGAPLGGQALFLGSAEVRIPIIWRVMGAGFIDTGQVWAHPRDIKPQYLEVAAGPGLLVTTPVGPVRADLAFRLTHYQTGQPNMVLNFSIGEPF